MASYVAPGQHCPVIPLESLNDRVWYAWNCLPRIDRGKPPSWKSLEKKFEISGATFSKLVSGERSTVDADTLTKLARALEVTVAWLASGEGEPPKPTGPIKPRQSRFEELDPMTWVAKYESIGGVMIERPNPFQIAALYHGGEVDKDIIEAVAVEARGREDTRTKVGWGRELLERQHRRDAQKSAKKRKAPRKSETETVTVKKRAS